MRLLRMAVKIWPRHDLVTREQTRHLRRAWIEKIQQLGDKWLLAPANHVQKNRPQSINSRKPKKSKLTQQS